VTVQRRSYKIVKTSQNKTIKNKKEKQNKKTEQENRTRKQNKKIYKTRERR
jgi:hypothetical protein